MIYGVFTLGYCITCFNVYIMTIEWYTHFTDSLWKFTKRIIKNVSFRLRRCVDCSHNRQIIKWQKSEQINNHVSNGCDSIMFYSWAHMITKNHKLF